MTTLTVICPWVLQHRFSRGGGGEEAVEGSPAAAPFQPADGELGEPSFRSEPTPRHRLSPHVRVRDRGLYCTDSSCRAGSSLVHPGGVLLPPTPTTGHFKFKVSTSMPHGMEGASRLGGGRGSYLTKRDLELTDVPLEFSPPSSSSTSPSSALSYHCSSAKTISPWQVSTVPHSSPFSSDFSSLLSVWRS